MKLLELHPQFRQGGPEWGDTQDYERAIAIEFDCPGCVGKPWSHRIWAPFLNRYPMDPGKTAQWNASGSGYSDLTFSDSPGHSRSIRVIGGCRSHFNITAGAIDFYGDSGHTTYKPQENTVTEQKSPPPNAPVASPAAPAPSAQDPKSSPTSAQAAPQPAPAKPSDTVPVVKESPVGYVRTHILEFVNGILHQVLEAPHENAETPKVLVPVPGSSVPPGLLQAFEQAAESRVKALEAAFNERLVEIEKKLNTPAPTAPPPASVPSS